MSEKFRDFAYAQLRRISIKRRLALVWGVTILLWTLGLNAMVNSIVNSYKAYVELKNMQLVTAAADHLKTGLTSLLAVTKYPVVRAGARPNDTFNYLVSPNKMGRTTLTADLEYQSAFLFEQNRELRLIAVFDRQGEGSYVKNNKKYVYQIAATHQPLGDRRMAEESWFVQTLAAKGAPLVWLPEAFDVSAFYLQDEKEMLFVSRAIMNTEPFEAIGVILGAVDVGGATESFAQEKLFDEQRMGFLDTTGRVLAGDLPAADAEAFLRAVERQGTVERIGTIEATVAGRRVTFQYVSAMAGYDCVVRTPQQLVLWHVLQQRLLMLLGLLAACVLITWVIIAIVRSVTRPVKSLVDTCKTIVQNGDFSVTIDDPFQDELSELTDALNVLTQRIEYLIYDVYEKKMELSQTQLQLLRSQVNPHFLYNTLETIRTKAMLCGQRELSDMALLLAGTLRYGISAPEELVSVATEVEKLEDYLRLQRLLYHDAFVANIHIEPEICRCRMIKFVLQPLVENALNHGLRAVPAPGVIDVMGYAEEGDLVFQVIDNGSGIPEDVLEDLREYLENNNQKFTSIGLKNVHRRIRMLYGEAYGVTIRSEIGAGTMIAVRIPRCIEA